MADQLSSFASAQDKNAEQQRALLGAIAESGSAGAQAYKAQQAQNVALQQAALSAATKAPSAQLADTNTLNTNMLNNAQQSFEQDIARQQAANGNYMSQVGAAIPIVESRTRASVEQTIADLQAKREQQAMDREMAQLQLQGQRESIAAQREARTAKAADDKLNGPAGPLTDADLAGMSPRDRVLAVARQQQIIGLTPQQQRALENTKADNARADNKIAEKERDDKRSAYLESLNTRWAAKTDDKGNIIPSESYKAVYDVVNGNMTLEQALATYKTPGGKKPLNRQAIEAEVSRILGIQ